MERIYLDYAASMPLAPEAKKAIADFIEKNGLGNPSSLHEEGRSAQALLDKAHTTVAAVFGVHPTEVVFTSGATESNATVIHGVLAAWRKQHKERPHIVFSAIEHPSWRAVAQAEEAEITLVPVSADGVVEAEAMLKAIKPNTALVGCMFVNNEIGTIQPVEAIGKRIEKRREEKGRWPVFHVDAVQAFPYLNTHSGHIHADTLTFSGHKYGALSGIGVLIVKKGTPMQSLLRGGSQEWGYRAGTENVLGAVTLAAVMEWNDAHRQRVAPHAEMLQEALESALAKELPDLRILGQSVPRAPHITYLWLPQVVDERFVHKLDLHGMAVSSGSACSSGAMLPSATLLAMGYSDREAFGGIRVSYGRFTTRKEIQAFVARFTSVLENI